jgi:hypothetical protein
VTRGGRQQLKRVPAALEGREEGEMWPNQKMVGGCRLSLENGEAKAP